MRNNRNNNHVGLYYKHLSGWWLITLHSNITWLTFTRSLGGSYGQFKTLTLYSDPCIQDTLSSRAALGLPAFRPSASREQRYFAYNSDPKPNLNQNQSPNPNPNPNPNEKFDLLPYIAMSRDVTWPKQFFAYNFSGKHFNSTSCGVIRNQRSKIRRFNIISTSGGPFRKILKFECRVI